MSATAQKETWLPAVRREMATWGVSHASLESGIAALVACAVKEERERCAKTIETFSMMCASTIRSQTKPTT